MNRKQRKQHDLSMKLDILSMILWLISGTIDWDTIPITFTGVWFGLMAIFMVVRIIYAEFNFNW